MVPGRIEDYALIGDLFSCALVGLDGSIDWLCLPRFDSPACFAGLLGTPDNGRWQIAPVSGGRATRRRYRGDTLILETEWDTPDGTVRVIDFMPERGDAADVVRIIEGVSGRVPMRLDLRLRFDYGRVVPWMRRIGDHLTATAGPDSVWLRSPIELEGRDFAHRATFVVCEGDSLPFVCTWHPSHLPTPRDVDPYDALDGTERFWTGWARQCTYDGRYRDAVVRSLATLKAMTYEPTGGIVAAATTSLPEDVGGVRNWDYRFCWLRDATMTLEALLRSGYRDEAKAWRAWLMRAVAGTPQDLQIMYGVAGERRLAEYELPWLPGYEDSRPVRVGNSASTQLQLDVFGEVADSLYLALNTGIQPERHAWSLQRALTEFLEGHWNDPDEGLWEVRGPRRHFVHSKVMTWVAVDRAVRMIETFDRQGPLDKWRALRDEIHREVCAKGFDSDRGTFTQSYGSKELDAALLLIPRVGFLPPDDPRVVGTVEAIQRELTVDGFVQRYETGEQDQGVDGLPGREGAFLACSFWLAGALRQIGRAGEARELFERLLDLRNDVGLLAEEYDPRLRRQVGNFPQAFSHVPLVLTAYDLDGHDGVRRARAAS
ncbi:glycoside hydrolase family 15 protein [Actinoallomurus spadix]|uniref:Glycoside hydrolase family 15 protein n=1 Tax=Actinoallomurus spadix TaxID=79912 RepID=A0ABP3HHL0_9ACTN|nr:glycoside hydrolase family 15 protein [Actinoallomurus spadix]MCO5988329.1 glycoside hydrolase family 15 protein [Actinoallomurus spadix]